MTSKLIESRPTLRPAEVLEFVPGVIVTQHSGDGKANQYFLRGFNLDHGTDFATWVDGMPVNMPTHAHGHGYSDLNWLIPELVDRIRYRKGPYFAEEGDFASAGSARIDLVDALPRGIASLDARPGPATPARWSPTRNALGGGEPALRDRGGAQRRAVGEPGEVPSRQRRRCATASATSDHALDDHRDGLLGGWNATDQIPQRAVDDGRIGRFGAIDPTDGGRTERYSLSFDDGAALDDGELRLNAYAIRSKLEPVLQLHLLPRRPGRTATSSSRPSSARSTAWRRAEPGTCSSAASTRSTPSACRCATTGSTRSACTRTAARAAPLDDAGERGARDAASASTPRTRPQWTPWFRSVAGVRADRF